MNWIRTSDQLPPQGLVVDTKLDDVNGVRNEQPLSKRGSFWWTADDGVSTYVYYTPSHWRYIS